MASGSPEAKVAEEKVAPEPGSPKVLDHVASLRTVTKKATKFDVQKVAFSWRNLSVEVEVKSKKDGVTTKSKKLILDDACGAVMPGEVLAIMGPSGSGKTTLLSTLVGKALSGAKQTGQVLLGGAPPGDNQKRLLSFVPQEDALMGVLTVTETLQYAARLAGVSDKDKIDEMVNDKLTELGLEVCKDTRVGDVFFKGISGGQKRRLSIGVELMKHPSIIVLDEPTSGLDSTSAYNVMANIRTLAKAGRTVLCTIHQPSAEVFFMCDKVCILSRGRQAYFGPTVDMVPYFGSLGHPCPQYSNPADYVMNLVNTDFGGHADLDGLVEKFRGKLLPGVVDSVNKTDKRHATYDASLSDDKAPPGRGSGYAASAFSQFITLASRNWLNNLRNPGVFWIRLFMYTMLSFMIGTMYLGMGKEFSTIADRMAILFYIAAFMVFMSIAALPFFIQTRAVFARERSNGAYSCAPYVISNYLTGIPGLLLISIVSSVVIYFMAGFRDGSEHFFIFALALFLSLLTAEAFMSLVAVLVPHYIVGIAIGAGVFGMFMLTEGFFIRPDDIPPYWIWGYYIGFHTYSYRSFIVNEFRDVEFDPDPTCGSSGMTSYPGNLILARYEMEDAEIWEDLLVLFCQSLIYTILVYVALRFKYRPRR